MPAYRTPGVYIEEISSGPRPIAPSSTTDTGFVAMLTLPRSVVPGRGRAEGMFLPGPDQNPILAWNRALAFRGQLQRAAEIAHRLLVGKLRRRLLARPRRVAALALGHGGQLPVMRQQGVRPRQAFSARRVQALVSARNRAMQRLPTPLCARCSRLRLRQPCNRRCSMSKRSWPPGGERNHCSSVWRVA